MGHDNTVKRNMVFTRVEESYFLPQYIYYINFGRPKCLSCGEPYPVSDLLHTEFCSYQCTI